MTNYTKIYFGSGVSSAKDYEGLKGVIFESMKSGIVSFDTAPSYQTEGVLSKVIKDSCDELSLTRENVFIQTKIDAWQMQKKNGDIEFYLDDALKKMNLDYLDALIIHWPVPEYLDATWKCMIECKKKGKVKEIGISNVRMRQLREIVKWEEIPTILQLERNPLRTCIDEIALCSQHGIKVQAYSPLCKMHPDIKNNQQLSQIAEKYQKNIGQIVLRWHLDTGVSPIFTSTKVSRVKEYANLNDFSLTQDEIDIINSLNKNYKMYLESIACPGF